MIDLVKIGQRIKEERKYNLHVSQEKMAEDLGMYQADISNMEKAKSGSGISDLLKLDLLADYFKIPLESLVFGREDKNMLIYHGNSMKLKQSKKKMLKTHEQVLRKLTGIEKEIDPMIHECGPYTLYTMREYQMTWNGKNKTPSAVLPKYHTFIFYEENVVGIMVADLTTVMQHIVQNSVAELQTMIPNSVLDVTDVLRRLNPYWALWMFTEDGSEQELYYKQMLRRMEDIRNSGSERPIIYIESVYIRHDNRQHGLFKMYIDLLKELFEGCILWLNMEPTSGDELDNEYSMIPNYTISDLGQLNLNAAIAERVGFQIDPDTWHRQAETTDAKGNITVEMVLIRKCAYYLPEPIRNLIKDDGDLVMIGRSMQKVMQGEYESPKKIDL